ncbi:MAG: methionine gamma-lyase family protein [Lachnospiraceae bacterium]|nr:methionine gamma-lyase family protein [Lachnospiraceae bacterium]
MTGKTYEEYMAGFGIDKETLTIGEEALTSLKKRFEAIDRTAEINQMRVLSAFQNAHVSEACLYGTTGYGYNDIGREALERAYADLFGAESALVRPQITCGTHAITLAIMSNLRPGDEIFSPVGKPYDTLDEVLGIREQRGSLAEYGVTYRQADLGPDGKPDFDAIRRSINEHTRMAEIQRSRGYASRPTLSVEEIGEIVSFIKGIKSDVICMVDNCYGEFVETIEPTHVGADIVAGSLIKNPGGGLAPIGGYIAGKEEYIENAARRLTSPGLGREVGATLGVLPSFYQGLFLAPSVTAAALKGAIFAAEIYGKLGFQCDPKGSDERYDIIQSVTLDTPERLVAFCEGIQSAAPVDSFVRPEPAPMPGYDSDVIMAAGAFVSGSSIELSADGPMREPYAVYFQGGLTWPHAKLGILKTVQSLKDKGLLTSQNTSNVL